MWFLVRAAFWLGIVALLMPDAPTERSTSAPRVGATQSTSAAKDGHRLAAKPSQHTLKPADLAEPWRGPRKDKASPPA